MPIVRRLRNPIPLVAWIALLAIIGDVAHSAMLAPGKVDGVVIDSGGKPAANVPVRFKKVVSRAPIGSLADPPARGPSLTVATTTSDKEGKFSQSLEAGDYFAEAGNKDVGYAREQIEIKPGQNTRVKLSLSKNDLPPK